MARNTQEAEVIITVNGEAAKQSLENLTKKQREFEKAVLDGKNAEVELEKLRSTSVKDLQLEGKSYKEVEAGIKARIKAGQEAQKNLNQLNKDIQITKVETKKFADILKNVNGSSLKELEGAAKQLKNEIRKLTPGTQEFVEKSKQLKEVNTRIVQLRNGFKGVVEEQQRATLSLRGVVDGFNKYWGFITMTTGAITGLSTTFRKCAEDAAKLDDVYADVMKTTGLMHDEVAQLDKELMKIDTRTSREQLLLLARDAGKLGITGSENILGFVRAADQIQVALGEDLGEGAIRNLGKIADVLGYTKSMGVEKALLSIGSAINAVGQDSTASEAYLVEFTQRLAGVGAQADISAADLIGFASGLDQSAMKVEMASTAFQKFLMKMFEDPAQFAAYAKMEVQEFTDLLKNDANTAITTVLKSLKDQDGFAAMVPIFKDMGLDGARAVSVLASMASNLDAVSRAQAVANAEFAKATSVTSEYNTKNNNLQAQLEKARKEFHNASVALGQSLNPVMLKSTKLATQLVRLLATHGKEIKNAAIAVAALTVAVKMNTIAETAGTKIKKVWNLLTETGTFLSNKAAAAYYRLTNQTLKYAAAQKAANAAASASVFGVIALLLGTLIYKLTELNNKEKEHLEIAEETQTTEQKIVETYAEEKGRIDALNKIVNNGNISLDKRKAALLELKGIVPGYHADLTEEGRLINANTAALDAYLLKFKQKIRLEAYKEDFAEAEKSIMDLQTKLNEANEKKEKMIEDNGGQEPDALKQVITTHAWPLLEKMGVSKPMVLENDMPGSKLADKEETRTIKTPKTITMETKPTEYGVVLEDIVAYESAIADLTKKQKELAENLGITIEAEKSEMQAEIDATNAVYDQMVRDVVAHLDDQSDVKASIDDINAERDREIASIKERYAATTQVEVKENAILTQAQFDILQERYDKLTKKEKAMVDAGYASLTVEDSKALKARYAKLMNADSNAIDKRYQQELKNIQQQQRSEQNEINRQYFEREITTEKHEEELRRIKMDSLQKQLELAQKYGKDTTQIEASILDEQVKNRKADYEKGLRPLEQRQKEEERALKRSLTAQEITQDQYDTRMLEIRVKYLQERLELAKQNGQDETTILQAILDAQVEAETLAFEQMEKLKKQAKDVKAGLSPKMARSAEENEELKKLDILHEAKLLSEEEYEQAVRNLHKKYAQANLQEDLQKVEQYTQQVNSVMQEASNFVGAMKEAESAKLEAQYQKDLTAAGDNAEKREQIEAEYEQKKLDLSKRYADVDMGINIAKAIAAGALAAIQAFAQLGPIAGAVAAGLIAATTAAEVATIIAQRNAIKNSSVNSPSSSGSSGSSETGERVITGYSEGGNTSHAASDSTPVGIVHANEWVAPAWMVRENPVVFKNLEEYRKAGSHGRSKTLSMGFAEGGYTGEPGGQAVSGVPKKDVLSAVRDGAREGVKEGLKGAKIRAFVVRRDIKELDDQDERFFSQTSRGSVTH